MAEKIYDGSLLRITLDGKTIYHETDASISIELSTKERTSKDIDGLQVAPDIISWNATGSALGVQTLPDGSTTELAFEDLFDTILAKAIVNVEFTLGSNGATGDTFYKGTAYMTSVDLTGTNREDATTSYSLTGSGVPAKDVIPV